MIGCIAAFVYEGCSLLVARLNIDDVVDAFAVHGACGLWGILALGFFGNPEDGIGGNGVLYGGSQLSTQLFAAVVIILWTGALSFLIFFPLSKSGMLRLSDEFQEAGADEMEHSPRKSYNGDGIETEGARSSRISNRNSRMSNCENEAVILDAPKIA